ncbi:MAG: ATP-binding protein, partial [Acidimicrobiia bacterium]
MSSLVAILVVALIGAVVAALWAIRRRRELERAIESSLKTLGMEQESGDPSLLIRSIRRLQQSTAESETEAARFRAVVESTALGVIVADERGTIVYANPVGRDVLEGKIGDATARNRLSQLIERVTTTGSPEQLDVDVYTPVRRFIRLRAVPLPSTATWGHAAVVYVRDLSGRRRVEAMRRDFLTNAGHEMKTPLGALAILAETIGDTDDPETRRRLAERLSSEANRMAQVVDDIVTLADIESLETSFEPVHIDDVISEAMSRISVVASEAGVKVELEEEDCSGLVVGNSEQLTSAVLNLLDNAVKYSPRGDDATVSLSVDCGDDEVRIEVEDHGIGISAEHLDRVFERFYRVQQGRGRSSGGTGLGLSIVRNVAETHGGSVSVESTPAEGSTFT